MDLYYKTFDSIPVQDLISMYRNPYIDVVQHALISYGIEKYLLSGINPIYSYVLYGRDIALILQKMPCSDTEMNDMLLNDLHMEVKLFLGSIMVLYTKTGAVLDISVDDSGKYSERWGSSGKYVWHRVGGPSLTTWVKGVKTLESWRVADQLYRTDGPALSTWHYNGKKALESWYIDGHVSKHGGPAVTLWYENGTKMRESWFTKGRLSRRSGPAVTTWYDNGDKESSVWYINGIQKYSVWQSKK